MTAKRSEADVVGHDPEVAGAIYQSDGDATDAPAAPEGDDVDSAQPSDTVDSAQRAQRSDTVRDLNRFQSKTVPPEQARAMMEVDLRAVDDGADPADETPGPVGDSAALQGIAPPRASSGRRRAVVIGLGTALAVGVALAFMIGGHDTPRTPATVPPRHVAATRHAAPPVSTIPVAAANVATAKPTSSAPVAAHSPAAPASAPTGVGVASPVAPVAAPPHPKHRAHVEAVHPATTAAKHPAAARPTSTSTAPAPDNPNAAGFPY